MSIAAVVDRHECGGHMSSNRGLWIVQVLLAAIFLVTGVSKFVMSPEAMTSGPGPALSVGFLRFIGVCELLGVLGLILPGLLNIQVQLTPIAACGLVIIMIGATTVTIMGGMIAAAAFPAFVGLLAAWVAYGRWPHRRPVGA